MSLPGLESLVSSLGVPCMVVPPCVGRQRRVKQRICIPCLQCIIPMYFVIVADCRCRLNAAAVSCSQAMALETDGAMSKTMEGEPYKNFRSVKMAGFASAPYNSISPHKSVQRSLYRNLEMASKLYKISPASLKYLETPELWKIIESDGELAPHANHIVQQRFMDNNIYTVPSAEAFKNLTDHSSDPIDDIIRYDRVKTLKCLVDAGLNLQHYSRSGWMLLGLALATKTDRISRYLIDASFPKDICGRIGALNDCEDGTFLSVAATWDAFVHGASGETAWHAAAECATDLEFPRWIGVQAPETINERTVHGTTPLMKAAACNRFPRLLSFFSRMVLVQRLSMMRVILRPV